MSTQSAIDEDADESKHVDIDDADASQEDSEVRCASLLCALYKNSPNSAELRKCYLWSKTTATIPWCVLTTHT